MKQVFSTVALTESKSTDVEGVGNLRYENDSVYRWIQNGESTVALTAGQLATHKFSDGADFLNKVYVPLTANLGALAGVVTSTSITAGEYGWIQCRGYNANVSVFASQTTAKTAGDTLIGVNAQTYADAGTTMGTAPKYTRNLLLLEAVATITTGAASAKKCYIACLG